MSRFHRIITQFLVLAAAAMTAPTAFAMPGPGANGTPQRTVKYVYSRPDRSLIPVTPFSQAVQAPRQASPATGYTATDAWITVGSIVALMALALSGVAVLRRREQAPAAATH